MQNLTLNKKFVQLAPLFFVRSGYVGNWWNNGSYTSDFSKLNYPGQNAWYWSRSSYTDIRAFHLSFWDPNVNPSDGYGRYYGFSLRCLYH